MRNTLPLLRAGRNSDDPACHSRGLLAARTRATSRRASTAGPSLVGSGWLYRGWLYRGWV